MIELGKRVRVTRNELLKLNQIELANALNSHQGVISRLEKGIGGSIELLLEFVTLLNNKKMNGHMLFAPHFSTDFIAGSNKKQATIKDSAINLKFLELKDTIEKSYEQIRSMDGLLMYESNKKKK